MILVSSLAMAVALAQPPAVRTAPPPSVVTLPVPAPPMPPRPPNMTVMVPGYHSPPPPPLPEPSAAANKLAQRLIERIGLFEREAQRSIMNQLLWGGGAACDRANEECRRIAEEIAQRGAASEARTMRDAVSRVLGAMFDCDMTPAQIAQAERFLGGDAGQALIGSLLSINEQSVAALGPPSRFFGGLRDDLVQEFARRTRHLPRASRPVPPPAPPPPPSPPRR